MKKKPKHMRVGNEFVNFKLQFQKDLEIAMPRKKFSDPEITDMIGRMFSKYRVIKFGKKKVTYV